MTLQGRSASCEAKREINKFVKFDRYSKVQIQQVSLLSCALQMEVAGKRSNSPQFAPSCEQTNSYAIFQIAFNDHCVTVYVLW